MSSMKAPKTARGTLCRAAVVYPGAQPYYAVVTVYEDLQGGAELQSITPLDLAALASGETP